MRTFEDLKIQVKRYLTSNTNLVNVVPGQSIDTASLLANIDEAILIAANSARREAEMKHDFGVSIMAGYVSVLGATEVDLDSIDVAGDGSDLRSFKTLREVFVVTDVGTMYPIKIMSSSTKSIQLFKQQDLSTHRYQEGYTAIVSGRKLSIYNLPPTQTLKLKVVGSVWLKDFISSTNYILQLSGELVPDITGLVFPSILVGGAASWHNGLVGTRVCVINAMTISGSRRWYINLPPFDGVYQANVDSSADTPIGLTGWTVTQGSGQPIITQAVQTYDWFLDKGFNYLQWAIICDLNFMLLKFVPRQEGTIAPPNQVRDAAFDSLVVMDSYATEGSIYHDL